MNEHHEPNNRTGMEIAVIGMACRFPGACNLDQFWENLKNGVESIASFSRAELEAAGLSPEVFNDPNFVNAKGIIDDIEYFDAAFFNYSPHEAEIMDPQLRVFHECVWEALEYAGYVPQTYPGTIGLYAGAAPNLFWEALVYLSSRFQVMGHFASRHYAAKDHLCMRISYKLNLRGPAISLYTACSTALVAIDQACRGLLTGHCDMALAGGITLFLPQKTGYMFQEGLIASPDGHCRAFDADARGTVAGDGAGVVVLKRLEDALDDHDSIHAVIRGFATNNDGSGKIGYTAPGIQGQANVIRAAQHMGDIDPESIGYIEAHGTGTLIGDPIEIQALTLAFHTPKKRFCAIGSVKTNFGHLDCAAGAAGFIKTVLALKHRLIPPSLHFKTPNPKIDFDHSPFYVNAALTEWRNTGSPLRAGVSAFGVGGTNAHIVLEEMPESPQKTPSEARPRVVIFSAKTQRSLDLLTQRLAVFFKKNSDCDLADAAYTLQVGRGQYPFRTMLVGSNAQDVAAILDNPDSRKVHSHRITTSPRSIVFMFPGIGAQYVNMGLGLYRTEPIFRSEMDRCFSLVHSLIGIDVKPILYPTETPGRGETAEALAEVSELVIFMLEYALARFLMKLGIKPCAMIGYSFGEYAAAQLSGIFSLEDALRIIVIRERLIRELPRGKMLSVPLRKEQVIPLLNEALSLAVDNGDSCIVSGSGDAVDAFDRQMRERRVMGMPVQTVYAVHSDRMKPILRRFEQEIGLISLHKPEIPYVSNVTGDWITDREALDPAFWAAHLAQTVRFSEGIATCFALPDPIFLEVGPGRDLSTALSRYTDAKSNRPAIHFIRPQVKDLDDDSYFLSNLGRLWLYGVTIDWVARYPDPKPKRIPLPTYPFDRQRYWLEGNPFRIGAERLAQSNASDLAIPTAARSNDRETDISNVNVLTRLPHLTSDYVEPRDDDEKKLVEIWQTFFGFERIGIHDDFFEMGGDSLKAILLASRIYLKFHINLPLAEMFNHPTIAQLAQYLKTRETESLSGGDDQLVLLKNVDNPDGCIFFIHGGTGDVDTYIDLCNLLPVPLACWGIRAGKLEDFTPETLSIREVAKIYIRTMKKNQSQGPYRIAGWSLGGVIAHEMAAQLEQVGEEVDFLGLIDSQAPDRTLGQSRLTRTSVHFFKAAESKNVRPEHWDIYCAQPVRYSIIPGDHFSIFSMPHLSVLAFEFQKAIGVNPIDPD
ncbi:MAG: type I polyketide synthase [Candidatus Omnitrophota bacterium]